ncbi:MAG: DUF805 domain-containing protein [Pseudoruegeria sp.]
MEKAVRRVLANYANFNGRASKEEFWWWVLATLIGSILIGAIDNLLLGNSNILPGLFSLAIVIPNLAVGARRLHDFEKSGWWQLIYLIPLIGLFVMIYLLIQPTDGGDNKYGPMNPL